METYGAALMLLEHMESCYVGSGRTDRTLTLMHIWIWMCHDLVYIRYIRYTVKNDRIKIARSPAIQLYL